MRRPKVSVCRLAMVQRIYRQGRFRQLRESGSGQRSPCNGGNWQWQRSYVTGNGARSQDNAKLLKAVAGRSILSTIRRFNGSVLCMGQVFWAMEDQV